MPRIALALLTVFLVAPSAAAASWQRPVDGPLLRAFAIGRDRYARGQHRGVDLGAGVGATVRGACAGRVTFAGRVPRGGRTISVRCGALYQQLGTIGVRVGAPIGPGTVLGTVGRSSDPRTPSPHLHLGARVAATGRYVDPLSLLGDADPGLPPVAPVGRARPGGAPLGSAPKPGRSEPVAGRPEPVAAPVAVAPALAPRAAPMGRGRPSPWRDPTPAPIAGSPFRDAGPSTSAPAVPWFVWVGLASVGLGLPLGGLLTMRERRRREARRALLARH